VLFVDARHVTLRGEDTLGNHDVARIGPHRAGRAGAPGSFGPEGVARRRGVKAFTARVAGVGVLALAGAGCGPDRDSTWWEDDWCNDFDGSRTTDIETVDIGLFEPDCMPWCIRDAEVKVSQWNERYPKVCKPFTLSDAEIAVLRFDGAMRLGVEFGSPPPCDLYVPDVRRDPDAYAWGKSFQPLFSEVGAPGCRMKAGLFTWNDHWYPWKSSEDDHWYVPLVMECDGRASDGSLLESSGPTAGE
jgi:hypothetical protein